MDVILISLQINLNNFDTHNVTDMRSLFDGCTNLSTIDISSLSEEAKAAICKVVEIFLEKK